MNLMNPNLTPGFQPCFVLETMRRYAEEKLDMAAYTTFATASSTGPTLTGCHPRGAGSWRIGGTRCRNIARCSIIMGGFVPLGTPSGCWASSKALATTYRENEPTSERSQAKEMGTSI